ncbi:MAG: ABC transporter ATP-binding protein [Candidatus Nitricoxidivorans perseverans]|uniref:ABC transporter ATP-binding protein n=1 Tax=Candidatus Nitricoxidivorans perseverans TaxID=2975601 RepID=A0AA49FJL1_9PROT|nr:MAG: ABC transporter ATP-binding protein [Candidatus Nitricoxidivorans perseverans]
MTAAVLIDNLTLRYPSGTVAVADLSLDIRPGEIFGLLGLNGAGKSSLIKAIVTLLRPSTGRVGVFGLDTRKEAAAVKRRIGVVPQENNLDTYLDVRQNLLFHCRYAGIPARTAAQRADRWLSLLEIGDKAGESVLHLSGGSKRKVMLAKAFITAPELLVLDEPSAGLDPEVRSVLWAQVRTFRAAGGTVFLSTHYLEEAEVLCDRIGILHRGQLAALIAREGNGIFPSDRVAAAFHAVTGTSGAGQPS